MNRCTAYHNNDGAVQLEIGWQMGGKPMRTLYAEGDDACFVTELAEAVYRIKAKWNTIFPKGETEIAMEDGYAIEAQG